MDKSKIIEKISEYIDRNYQSKDTILTYKSYAKIFVMDKHPDTIEKLSEDYLLKYVTNIRKKRSISVYNHYVSILKLLYCSVLLQNKLNSLKCLKQYPKLKSLPSRLDVCKKIENIRNLKHRTILTTAIKTGLRVSELLNIKLEDINRDQMKILIPKSKGNRSEFVIMTEDLLKLFEEYYRQYKPNFYLFEGINGKYSSKSVNNIVKKHIGKEYSIHWMRHIAITYVINEKFNLPQAKLFSRHKSDSAIHFYYNYDKNVFDELRQSIDRIGCV